MVYLIGAGGHAKVVAEILELMGEIILDVYDDKQSNYFKGNNIAGDFSAFIKLEANNYILAIGNNNIRQKLSSQLANVSVSIAIHPSASIAVSSKIGGGTVIMANSTVNSDVSVGENVIINTNASVDHDCFINNFVHISPQVALAGNITVGEGTHIGIGAIVIQGLKIGCWAVIGAGAVIIADVPDFAVVVGNPGRIIKYNREYK